MRWPDKLNPLKDLPNPREVFAWSLYDLANQSFTLLIITVLFPVYFRQVVVGDPDRGDALWGQIGSASLLLVVLLSPFVGAFADAWGIKKRLLIATGIVSGVLTLGLSTLGPGTVAWAAALFITANVCYQIGENLLASFLPEISTQRTIGRVSAFGWTMGYVGALALLIIVALTTAILRPTDLQNRWFFLLAGAWFLLGLIPTARVLREVRPDRASRPNPLREAASRLKDTIRQAGKYRQLIRFLVSFGVFAMGVQAMIYFAVLLLEDFGFGDVKKFLFMIQLTVTAAIGAIASGWIQRYLAARGTVLGYLAVWIATGLGLILLSVLPPDARPEWLFWSVGNGFGIGLGGIGSASRAMVGRFTPTHKTAEFFGLWGMTYKLAGAVGLFLFGTVKSVAGDTASLIVLTAFFSVGAALLMRVDERSGLRACARDNRDNALGPLNALP